MYAAALATRTPAAWALWTAALCRPRVVDDEDVPEALELLRPWCARDLAARAFGVRFGEVPWSRKHPTTLAAVLDGQTRDPAPSDACARPDGGCTGACAWVTP